MRIGKQRRMDFISAYFKLVHELPFTSVFLRWSENEGIGVSKSTAIQEIKEASSLLGISFREPPNQLVGYSRGRRREGVSEIQEVKVINKPSTEDKDVELSQQEILKRIAGTVYKMFEKEYGKDWKMDKALALEANNIINDRIKKGMI